MARILLSALLAAFWHAAAFAENTPAVAVSIKPIHSLVSAVMDGVGEPVLLLDGHASPHTYALKPSGASALENADIIFRVGPELETFLNGPLRSLGSKARVVDLVRSEGLILLENRPAGVFSGSKIGTDTDHDNDHGEDHDHDDHDHEHKAGGTDMHLWLDPNNAALMTWHIATVLIEIDPDHANRYQANAKALTTRIDDLSADVATLLQPVRETRYLVFHDAYHYFENRFGLHAAGSFLLNPQSPPGAETIAELSEMVEAGDIACAFVEPQFSPHLVDAVAGAGGVRIGTLDPLGAALAPGPAHYEAVIGQMARSFKECLGG